VTVALGGDRAILQFHHGRKFSGTPSSGVIGDYCVVNALYVTLRESEYLKDYIRKRITERSGVKDNHTNDFQVISSIHVLIILLFCSRYKYINNN